MEQDDAVRDESRERAGVLAPAHQDETEHDERVDQERRAERVQEPVRHSRPTTVAATSP
jgi:hypothetical protein